MIRKSRVKSKLMARFTIIIKRLTNPIINFHSILYISISIIELYLIKFDKLILIIIINAMKILKD